MNSRQEKQILEFINRLLEFFHTEEQHEMVKETDDPNLLYNFVNEEEFYTDKATQQELEEDLANSVQLMKNFASSFSGHFKEDEKRIKRLNDLTNKNKKGMDNNISSITNFEMMSKNLSMFALLKMSAIALVLFVFTLIFIYFDALIF